MRIANRQLPMAETRQDGLQRFSGCLHSGRGFRFVSVAINGPLTGSWCVVSGGQNRIFEGGAWG